MKTLILFFLCVVNCNGSGGSLFDYVLNRKNPSNLSSSYLPAAIQVTAYYLHQMDYINNGTSGQRSVVKKTIIIHDTKEGNVVVLEYEQPEIFQETKRMTHSANILKSLLLNLNKDAKRNKMDTLQGFSTELYNKLSETSKMSAPKQLTYVLQNIDNASIREGTVIHINRTMSSLQDTKSELYNDLMRLKPLVYRN